ncbi:hypothetical protein CTAM01_05036, partial [Colletotrichum tamarilloi]
RCLNYVSLNPTGGVVPESRWHPPPGSVPCPLPPIPSVPLTPADRSRNYREFQLRSNEKSDSSMSWNPYMCNTCPHSQQYEKEIIRPKLRFPTTPRRRRTKPPACMPSPHTS